MRGKCGSKDLAEADIEQRQRLCPLIAVSFPFLFRPQGRRRNGMTAHGALVSGGITRLSRLWWRRLARLQSSCCVVRSSAHVDCDGVAVPSDHVVNDWNGALKKRWECRARMSNGNQLGCPREEKQQAKGCDLENRRLRLTEDGWNIAL